MTTTVPHRMLNPCALISFVLPFFREKVIRVVPGSDNELKFLTTLQDNQDLEVSKGHLESCFTLQFLKRTNPPLRRCTEIRYINYFIQPTPM